MGEAGPIYYESLHVTSSFLTPPAAPPSQERLVPVSQVCQLTPEPACPCPHIQGSDSAGLQLESASLHACS